MLIGAVRPSWIGSVGRSRPLWPFHRRPATSVRSAKRSGPECDRRAAGRRPEQSDQVVRPQPPLDEALSRSWARAMDVRERFRSSITKARTRRWRVRAGIGATGLVAGAPAVEDLAAGGGAFTPTAT